jgi:signal peptide peptidase SppA
MRVPFKYRDRKEAYKNARDRSVISAAIRGSVYRDVPLEGLIATQRHVNDDRVHQYAQGVATPPAKHSPVVLEHRGRFYLHNGHHRAAAALERGETTLRARFASLDGPKKFAADSPTGTLLMIDPRAMAASYMPREEPCVEIVDGGIAVLTIEGPLESKPCFSLFAYYDDYESIMQRFRDALESDDVKSVLLKIDSPGGMAAGLNATVDAMRKLKKQYGKPITAYADEKCCSAAYALACVADHIYLPPAAEIGSIGVTSTLVDATRANKKAGLRIAVVTSGARKADGNPDVEISPEALAHMQARVDHLADIYFRLVEKSRGLSVDEVKGLEANTFDGQNAVDVGLADAVWTLEKTLASMRGDSGTLDRSAGAVTNNDLANRVPAGPEKSKMTLKLKQKAVAQARKALAAAKAELAASMKTPPARASDEEDEEEKGKSKTKYIKRTEEIEEEEIGSTEGSESPASESPPAEEEGDESSAEEEADEADEEEAEGEEDEEGATDKAAAALMALAQSATGKRGKKAIGALAAMLAEGQRAAKRVNKISAERRRERKALAIDSALARRHITRHEARDLRKQSSSFVSSFLSMRKKPLIATDEEELKTPAHTEGGDLPKSVLKQIQDACAAVPEAQRPAVEKKMIEAQRERLAANGAGSRY